jgi:hypothetical protein
MGTQNASHRDESGVTAASEGFHAAEWKVGGFGSLPRLGSVTSYDRPTKKIASSAQALPAALGIICYTVPLILLRLRTKMILEDTATGAAINSRRAIQ